MSDLDDNAVGGEAEAQRIETVMPLIWGALGLVVVAAFVVWVMVATPGDHVPRNPPAAAPTLKPPGQSY